MKDNIHPPYKKLKVRIGDEEMLTMSTYKDDNFLVEIDYRKHPAWTGNSGAFVSSSNKNVNSFNSKFAGLSFMSKPN